MRHGERSIDQGKQALGVNTCSLSLAQKRRNRENTTENRLAVRHATTFGATTINTTIKRALFAGVGACEPLVMPAETGVPTFLACADHHEQNLVRRRSH